MITGDYRWIRRGLWWCVVPVAAADQQEEWFQPQTHPCCTWYSNHHHKELIFNHRLQDHHHDNNFWCHPHHCNHDFSLALQVRRPAGLESLSTILLWNVMRRSSSWSSSSWSSWSSSLSLLSWHHDITASWQWLARQYKGLGRACSQY